MTWLGGFEQTWRGRFGVTVESGLLNHLWHLRQTFAKLLSRCTQCAKRRRRCQAKRSDAPREGCAVVCCETPRVVKLVHERALVQACA